MDNGIAAADIIAQAPETMDIIVTDHHLVPEKIPNAIAVLNPIRRTADILIKNLQDVEWPIRYGRALALNSS